jgi:predicted O-methyltransferase YrrM
MAATWAFSKAFIATALGRRRHGEGLLRAITEGIDNQQRILDDKLSAIVAGIDDQQRILNDKLGAIDSQQRILHDKLSEIAEGTDNQQRILNDKLGAIAEGIDSQQRILRDKLSAIAEGTDNQQRILNDRLGVIAKGIDNTQKLINDARRSTKTVRTQDVAENAIDDVELIERFSLNWPANAAQYTATLGDLRVAARRLLHADTSSLSDQGRARLRRLESEIACLARNPRFFPEMFHGVTPCQGGFTPLSSHDRLHLRASGLLGAEDRLAIQLIYERMEQASASPLRVVEIGSAAGRGSTPIGGEIVKRARGTLYCIDPWGGLLYLVFLSNMQIFELEGTVAPIRSPSAEAAVLFEDGSLDGVFIDGSHLYPDVLADIAAFLPKVRKGGIMFGHDLHDVPSRFVRQELLKIANVCNAVAHYRNDRGEFEPVDVHAGVILAVQDYFGDCVERFPGSIVWAKQV